MQLWPLVATLLMAGALGACSEDESPEGAAGSAGSAGSAGAGSCITSLSAAEKHVFVCDGLSYDVSVPEICTSTSCGLIFDVHGFTMSGVMQNANTNLAALGRTHGYIVVNPNAEPDPPLASWKAAEDDAKIFSFLEQMITAFSVDPKRVHFTGFSQGGDMTWRMVCNHSDVIASAAPAAFGHSENEKCFSAGVAPARPLPILFMHGTADALVPFSEAEAARDRVIAAEGLGPKETVSEDADHVWNRWTNASGTVFEMIAHDYTGVQLIGGHCYPGSTDPGGEPGQFFSFKCDQPSAFTWGDVVMQFFIAHPMK